ncbi:MAG: OmpA family protein [Spirosomataceae bacterium]
MKNTLWILLISVALSHAVAQVTPNDGDWSKHQVVLKNTAEADVIIRVGDIDNLGFGWAENFNPFTGRSTESHGFPWEPKPDDLKGLDRILLGTSLGKKDAPCGADGYSGQGRQNTVPVAIKIPLSDLQGTTITAATLTLFVDDFQATVLCSKFQVTLNGKRFVDLEKIINFLNQTGPIGKFITVKIPDDLLPLLQQPELSLLIDDPTTGAGDGYAIDFVKLLINPKPLLYKGSIKGFVKDRETQAPIASATVRVRGYGEVKTDTEGAFVMENVPIGLNVAEASATGYATNQEVFDVIAGEEPETKDIFLDRSKAITFNNRQLKEGDSVVMNNIQFNQGSYELLPAGITELNRIYDLLQANPKMEIELSGHTSNEGERALNTRLSKDRVNACKQYLVRKGIDEGRIVAVGYGPDRPVAPNDNEAGRAKNRRVEMRMLRVQ